MTAADAVERNATDAAGRDTAGAHADARLVVTFDHVSKTFGTQAVLQGVTCTLTGGTVYAVTGANGSGKSTFLRLAGHLLRASEGNVVVEDNGTMLTREALRRELGLLSPELALSPELTGEEAMDFLLGLRGITLANEERNALMERVGLKAEDANKRTKACSTGQRQRLALAVLIASNARLWLLDEPGANLDAKGRDVVRREARKAAECGAIVLVATNDENEAAWADEVIELGGRTSVIVNREAVHQTQAPSPRELSAKLTEGVAKVGRDTNVEILVEGTTHLPLPNSSTNLPVRTSDTPPAASRPSPLGEGGVGTRASRLANDNKSAFVRNATAHILRRELTSALRSRSSLAVMALFAITALLALSMALGGAVLEPPLLAALLWTLLFFAASMGLGGTFAGDEATGALLALRVYGAGQAVLAGKTAFAFLTLAALAALLVPLFFVLLDASCVAPLLLLATLVCGLAGLAGAGTLLSALTVGAAARQTSAGGLLPVLLLPVILPVFLPAITLTSAALGGREAGLSMLVGMGLYDLLLIVSASLLFDSLWYED